jgi:AcrR family transcriptional regulator
LRKTPPEWVSEIVRSRLRGEPVSAIAAALNLSKSTIYNYLSMSQEASDEAFIDELEGELKKLHTLHYYGGEGFITVSEGARRLAKILSRYPLPPEVIGQAILNAHRRRLKACRRRRS